MLDMTNSAPYWRLILKALLNAPRGLTIHQILDKLADLEVYPNKDVVEVILCQHKTQKGHIATEKDPCNCCGYDRTVYRLTEDGRRVACWNPNVVPPSQTIGDLIKA